MKINNKKIKSLRIKNGFSQEELAEESGLNLRTIQRIENGVTIPRGDSLKRIATALKVSSEIFVTEKQEDETILTILNLSQLGFLLFLPLSFIIPLFIYMKKKEQYDNVEFVGKAILNFQISWNLSIFILIIFLFIDLTIGQRGEMLTFKRLLPIPLIIILYFYNFIMIVINTTYYKRRKKVRYFPSVKFFN